MKKYLVSETYEVVTENSAECGEAEETGFNFENVPLTAQEIADYLKDNGFIHASSSHYHNCVYFSTESEQDTFTGNYETRNIHFTNGMPERIVKAICNYSNISLTF